MTGEFGNYGLMAAVLAAAGALVAAIAAARFRSAAWIARARSLLVLVVAALTVCAAALASAILGDSFDLASVVRYSERALPVGYKLAAFWAGQAGSMLLWAWMIAAVGLAAVVALRKRDLAEQAGAAAAVAAIAGFFAALMLLVSDANPFSPMMAVDPATQEAFLYVPPDGDGLNPMLQDPAMMAHPPILFLGYAGFAAAFALLIGGLAAGRLDGDWLRRIRRWVLGSWVLLTAGILLGSWWAYVELGWGGYWAWDPVENASLLPWLTATALLHTMVVQRSRGIFRGLTAGLIALTFLLCIFGTYLTRSGVIQSVHSFGKSQVGSVLLTFLVAATAASVVLMVARRKALVAEKAAPQWGVRETVFFAVASIMVLMMLVTAAGTLCPLFAGTDGARVAVEQSFYNRYVLELLGLPLLALVLFSPFAPYGGTGKVIPSRGDLRRWLGPGGARLGAQVSHLGVIAIAVGVAGSGLFGTEQVVRLAEGQSASVGRYTVTLQGLEDIRGGNYGATEAAVAVAWPGGQTEVLRPQQRRYNKSRDMVNHEIALASSLREDLYVALAGGDEKGETVYLKVMVKPLLIWIWIGGITLALGGLVPRLIAALWGAAARAPAEERRCVSGKVAALGAGRQR